MLLRTLLFVLAIGLVSATPSFAAIPSTISYQGLLLTSGGSPVPNGTYDLTFGIYDAASGPNPALWAETQVGVQVTNGVFSVLLGEVVPIALAFADQYWLGVQVGADPELTPRTKLASAPYAHISKGVEDGAITTAKIAAGAVTSAHIADASITTADIQDEAITAEKLAPDAIDTSAIADSAITTTNLADDAVTTDKIQDAQVTTEKLQDSSVSSLKIAPAAVTSSRLSFSAVTAEKIALGAIGPVALAADAVIEGKIAPNAVTTENVQDGAIKQEQLDELAVTTEKLQDQAVTTEKVQDNAIKQEQLDELAVALENMQNNSVNSQKVADNSLTDLDILDEPRLVEAFDTNGVTNLVGTSVVNQATASWPASGVIYLTGYASVVLDHVTGTTSRVWLSLSTGQAIISTSSTGEYQISANAPTGTYRSTVTLTRAYSVSGASSDTYYLNARSVSGSGHDLYETRITAIYLPGGTVATAAGAPEIEAIPATSVE